VSSIELKLDVYSHNFAVSEISSKARGIVLDYTLSLVEIDYVKKIRYDRERNRQIVYYEKISKRVYGAAKKDRSEFRFHINSFNEFIFHLQNNGLYENNIKIVHHDSYESENMNLSFIDNRIPREDQEEAIQYLSSDSKIKILTSQTGFGKTLSANWSLQNINKRTVIIVKGMYVQRWLDDLHQCFKFKKEDIMVVRGSQHMTTLIELAKENILTAKIIIITNTTFRMFIDDYEENNQTSTYGCKPIELFPLLKAGVRLIDEVHQDFHLNFKIDLYTHIHTTINLTATLKSDNKFLNKMYLLMFPIAIRPNEPVYNKYIAVKAFKYHLIEPFKARYKQRGRSSYSHVVYEEYIMKNKRTCNNYFNMIMDIVQKQFVSEYIIGQKMIIFCSTTEMCTRLTEYLKNLFIEFDVSRYIAEDNYSVLNTADIIVSTLKSSGTAVDIPNLKTALMTVAIGSRQANEQAVGRLRVLKKYPGVVPEFIYLVCQDIASHREYHLHKKDVLSDKILSINEVYTGYKI
jgi:superfamily II DNA or RNA helicase